MLLEETIEINLGDEQDVQKLVQFGKNLTAEELAQWVFELKKQIKVFDYTYIDMPSLDTNIVVHHLTLHLDAKFIKQKPRCMHLGKALLVKFELQKMLDAKFIETIAYSKWLSNLVIVPIPNGRI